MTSPKSIIALLDELDHFHKMWHGKVLWARPEQCIQAEHEFYERIPEVFPLLSQKLREAIDFATILSSGKCPIGECQDVDVEYEYCGHAPEAAKKLLLSLNSPIQR